MRLKDKPLLFSSAIILSITGSCLAIIGYCIVAFFYTDSSKLIESITNSTSMDKTSSWYFLFFALLYLVSLYGVFLMVKWKKAGFFLYLISQVVILFLPVLWINKNAFSSTNAIFTLLFLLIYLSFYKKMEK